MNKQHILYFTDFFILAAVNKKILMLNTQIQIFKHRVSAGKQGNGEKR